MDNTSLYKKIRILEIIEEVKDFKTFVFENGHGISYKAGQYLTLVKWVYAEEIRRSYSLLSTPVLNESLSIGVKRMENGYFSRLLVDHAVPGDELITTGAGGFFVLPENIEFYKQIFFFTAGSGIAPIYSLLKTTLHLHPHFSIILIYSNKSPGTTVFLKQLQHLQRSNNRTIQQSNNATIQLSKNSFHLELLFSSAPDLVKARLHRELLIELVNRFSKGDYSRTLFYICGPLPYMRMCTFVLQELQVPAENIKKENFIIDQLSPPQQLPPDKDIHEATIRFQGNEFHIPVHYPDSILQAAKKKGIALPYSCETGRCGNCVARCIEGTIWHSYNEVLTHKELSQGLVLTCVGHPVGGDVELEI